MSNDTQTTLDLREKEASAGGGGGAAAAVASYSHRYMRLRAAFQLWLTAAWRLTDGNLFYVYAGTPPTTTRASGEGAW